ncbi:MAG: TonB-dependent receptor [Pseudomonadota bacterium]
MKRTHTSNPIALAVSTFLIAGSQTVMTLELEEVVVTAQKREQSVQDVGITVNAFSGDALSDMGLTSSNEIAAKIPNVTIGSPAGEGGVAVVFIRGVGLNDFATNNTGPVGMYIDEVYAGSSNAQVTTLLDIERVEVLKGPQGTLFGRNTTGGAINILSAKPTEELEGYVKASYGSYSGGNDEFKIEGALSGPLSDTLRGRVAFVSYGSDGYMKNLINDQYVEKSSYAGRVLLDWTPTDTLGFLLNVHVSDNDSDADLYNSSLDDNFYQGVSDIEPVIEVEQNGLSLKVDYALTDSIELVSITAYDELDKFAQEDADMLPFPIIHTDYGVESETLSQELRLVGNDDSLNWIAGLYYLTDELDQNQGVDLTGAGLPVPARFINKQELDTWAVFGQLEYDLSDTLVVTAGLRYTDLQVDFASEGTSTFFVGPGGTFPNQYSLVADTDDSAVSGKLGLNWHIGDSTMLFGSVSKGFKGAGINGNFLLDLNARLDYDSEELIAYEIGIKSTFLDDSAQLNAAVFFYDYSDAQVFNNDPIPGIGLPANTIRNADVSMSGFDADFTWTPVSGLYLQLGMGYISSEYDENILDPSTGLLAIEGNQLQNTPELSAFGLINYEWDFGDNGIVSAQLDASYSDDIFYSTREDIAIGQEAYTIANARIAYSTANEKLEVAVWGKNLSDKQYAAYSFDLRPDFGFIQNMRGVPRSVGLDLKYSF